MDQRRSKFQWPGVADFCLHHTVGALSLVLNSTSLVANSGLIPAMQTVCDRVTF